MYSTKFPSEVLKRRRVIAKGSSTPLHCYTSKLSVFSHHISQTNKFYYEGMVLKKLLKKQATLFELLNTRF